MDDAKRRFFILSSGRAGSTLCSSIFVQAGARFAHSSVKDWDRRAGAYEHKEASYAAEHHNCAIALKDNSHISRWQMWKRKYHRSKAKANTKKLLEKADWVKLSNSGVVRLARTLGYSPTIILLYRPFEEYVLSSYLRSGRNYSQMLEFYYNTYSTALVALQIYGGCIIEYSEITDLNNTEWIERISTVTDLNRERLLAARDDIVDKKTAVSNSFPMAEPRLEQITKTIQHFQGKIVEAHRLSQRKA